MRLFLVPYVGELSSDLAPAGGSMKAIFSLYIYTYSWMRNSDDSASFPIFCGKAGKYRAKGNIKKRFLVMH